MRWRSIQWKLVLVYLLLIVLAMELIGVLVLRSLEQYYLDGFAAGLQGQGQLAAGFLARYLTDKPDQAAIRSLIDDLRRQIDADIAVIDAGGAVLGRSRPGADGNADLARAEIDRALAGSTAEARDRDPVSGARRIAVAVPVRSGSRVVGAVHLAGAVERIYETLADVRRILVTASGLALLITAIAGAALAKTITGPIQEVTRRAAAMATGRFDQEIQVRSADEVGQLGAMFNHLARRLAQTLAEIRQEKSRVEAIVRHMTDGVMALDHDRRILLVNPAAAAMLGVPADALIGHRPSAILPEPVGAILEELAGADGGGRELAPPGLPRRILRVDVAALRGEDQRLSGAVLVLRDVTEQARLERMRREFVANVSHELKTPITTIKSYVETLLDGALDEPAVAQRFLSVVNEESERMSRLVSNLLQLSQLDSRQLHFDWREVDPADCARRALAKLEVAAARKDVALRLAAPPAALTVRADSDRLEQVLLNVLSNAIDFTPAGGSVSLEVRKAGPHAEIVVRDTGVGIPEEDLPHIFERFYRVDKARSRQLGGTGLGLAIARDIVTAHGGTIQASSRVGRGTTVTISIPLLASRQGVAR